jgi:hypothetical protein
MEITENKELKTAQSIVGTSQGRSDLDFYPTPPEATLALLDRERFDGVIWEPACGDGAMSKVLQSYGPVISTDVFYRGFGEGGIDFLKTYKKVDCVITNPPFRLAEAFVRHGLEVSKKKVAMLLKIQFLEGASRHKLFKETPLKKVYVFSKRLKGMNRDGAEMKNSSMICFAWYVWEHGYNGEPCIDWIL